ncbi:MAG: extracellular solute-binding protein, partial [Clostridia bacterium]|nr:extracellular solute-binding protein [Clostridia bacterium]
MPIGGQYSYNMFNELTRIIMAGDDAYDIIMPTIQDAALLARDGMLYDLRKNGNVDLSMPWWSQMFDEETALDGKSYYANGDVCMSFIRASYCMLFNKSLIEDYKLEDPYELVEKGEWTMDKVLELSEAFATDTNGDGEYTSADNVGLGVLNNHVEVFFTSAGCKFVE